eukprot:7350771-Ditylum_brightwellii.AAC.1
MVMMIEKDDIAKIRKRAGIDVDIKSVVIEVVMHQYGIDQKIENGLSSGFMFGAIADPDLWL